MEFIKHTFQLLLRDTRALVGDLQYKLICLFLQADLNNSLSGAELHGIIKKIKDSVDEKRLVSKVWRGLCWCIFRQPDGFFCCRSFNGIKRLINYPFEGKRKAFHLLTATFQTGNIEKITYHPI